MAIHQELIRTSIRVYTRALKDGVLVRPKQCSVCPSTKNIEGHHEDYSKPLEIIWLCKSCHHKRHRRGKAASKLTRQELAALATRRRAEIEAGLN